MSQHKLLIRTIFVTTVAIFLGIGIYSSRSLSQTKTTQNTLQTSPHALVDQVWQILNTNYVDGSFNHQNWRAVRQQYLSHTYTSKKQAYTAIRKMVAKLGDRYTEFFDPQEFKALDGELSGSLTGIGVELTEDQKTKALTVVAPIKDSPAFVAGILPEDIIIQIDQKLTTGMSLQDAVKRIQGSVGTQIVLKIKRGSETHVFKLTRATIPINPVAYQAQDTSVGKIGYIQVPEFTETAPQEMLQAIEALEKQQVQGYILDLRSDPGGLLDSCLKMTSMWLKKGEIVSLVNRNKVKEHYDVSGYVLTNKPLVILVNQGSASASEILSGALQDANRAKLIGTRTFGKGLVQSVEPLSDGSALKYTIARYYTPKGRDINHVGIVPDVKVEISVAQLKLLMQKHSFATSSDPQYNAALQSLNQSIHMVGVNK
jgi:carboxyl-terminal processing protease